MFHLMIGNALIGLGEGSLLAWLFPIPRRKAVAIMILANYVSAWIGGALLQTILVELFPMDLNNGWRWLWIMVVLTYILTLIIEWPFVAWYFRGEIEWLKNSLLASLFIQSASYLILFGWYWMASGASIYTKTNVVAPADLSLPESVLVYFIASGDGNVYRRQLTGGDERMVYELQSTNINDRLIVRPNAIDASRWDLIARVDAEERRDVQLINVLTNLPVEAASDLSHIQLQNFPNSGGIDSTEQYKYEGTWQNHGPVQSLASATNSPWTFWAGISSVHGLRASNQVTGESSLLSFDTPFGAWAIRNVVHLPSDKVLFQLGENQICAFDPAARRVALLWHGRGPVAVIKKNDQN
jgi:hypothetical protein